MDHLVGSHSNYWAYIKYKKLKQPNLDFCKFFCSEELLHLKDAWKGIYIWHLNKIITAVVLIYTLPRPEIALPNLDIHQFSYCERLTFEKILLKGNFFMALKKIIKAFVFRDIHFWKPKLGCQIWASISFPIVNNLYIWKGT